ncbi:FG-GAP-like repeat-containing protein, partial [Ekhidna sp.]
MKSYWKSIFVFLFLFSTLFASAQENCSNGIDDDGDGLIDCYDGECSDDGACDDFFFGNTVICADDIDVTTFAIREQWGSDDQTATSHVTPAIGDLDGNGIPEVVSINNYGSLDLFVLNGATGETIASADIGFTPENAPVIARIDGDEIGDIIVSQNKGDDLALYNIDISTGTLTQVWRERASVNQPIGLPGVADFDEDGDVEIYYRNEVMDALTGNVIIAGDGNWEQDYTHGSIAVDILPDAACADCAGLELVSGNEVWAINEASGTRTLVRDMDDDIHTDIDPNLNYYPKYYPNWDDQWSTVSAADYNLDGNIDLLMSGALGTAAEGYNGETTIFYWDVTNGNVITYHDPTNNFVRGPGRINIGDVDGNGQLNANFVMNQKLYSLDENFNIHWIHPIKEGSSGFTGCSLFDFDGDGAVEVVYRSEESLLIVDGVGNGDNTTSERREIACVSRTQEEYPVIADVDGDGSSEICVSCYFNNSTSFSPYSNTQFSQIRVYESDGEAWMPARGVWNQHGYYNVNINDDLTVPTEVQDHSVIFSLAGSCEYSDGSTIPFDNRPLNTFLNQAPILNEEGCVEFASPDIDFVGIVSATDALCPNAEITVAFEITNIGDVDISGNLPVSYYYNDPRTADGVLLDTEVTLLVGFDVGETLTITQTISGVGGDFELFVVINDNGGTPPLTVPLPTSTIPECETGNNIQSTLVGFQTFDLSVADIVDNRKCDPTLPDNGSARAFYFGPTPSGNETIWLENFEDRANSAKSDTDETAWTSDGGSESPDFYGVSSYNGSKMFSITKSGTKNDVGIVTWTSEDIVIADFTDINISLDIFENGNQESSGEWRDFVRASYELRDINNNVTESGLLNNGSQFGDFTYAKAFASNLNSDGVDSLLILTVELHNTSSSEHHYIDNISVDGTGPDIIKEFTEADGFVFNWYNDNDYSTIIYTGSQYPQMATGTYDVIGFYAATQCYSDTVEVNINLTAPIVRAWVYEISPLDDCNTPNGSLDAFVYTQTDDGTFPASVGNPPQDTLRTADGYGFNWRITNDATNTSIGTGSVIQNLTNQSYTVDVVENLTGCTTSADLTVSSDLTFPPDPSISVVNISSCGGTGQLSADVAGNTADFTFEWFDGTGVKPAADFTGVTYTVSDPGQYTVRATSNITGCPSNPVTQALSDVSSAPNPATTLVQNNTSCVAGNGIVSADGDGAGNVTDFTFEWFLGANTLVANTLPGTAAPGAFLVSDNPYELGGLEEGTYTVRVTDNATSCFETRTIDVVDTPGSLVVTAGNLIQNDINSCDATVLGSIDASGVVPGSVTDVSIGNINSSFENLDITTNNDHIQSFDGGNIKTYQQDFINGWSTTAGDQRIEIWHNNNTQNGSIHDAFHGDQFAEINANQTAALYFDLATVPGALLNWSFAHKGRAGTDVISVNIGEPGAEVVQGSYSTGNTAWAFYEGEYTIPVDQFTTRFQFEAVSTAGGNNSVGNFVDTVSFVLFPYRFELYQGATVSGTADFINTTGVFNNLDDGDYVLVVYDNLTGCGAVEIPITIARVQDQPTIVAAVTDDANCDNDAGSIDVTTSMAGAEPASYTYEIFDGHSFTSQRGIDETVADGSIPFTFSNLAPGDYRIRVTNDDTKCTNFEDVIVDDITDIPTFSVSQTIVDNSSCAGTPNGFLSVSIQGDAESNYTFSWWNGTDTSGPADSGPAVGGNPTNGNSLSGLAAGDYTVIAENTATGCETVELTLTVGNDPYIPNVIISEDAPQTDCATGNGILSAIIDNNPDFPPGTNDITGFSFQWQLDGVDLADGVAAANGSVPSGTQTATVSGLIADEYTLIVTHDDPSGSQTICSATESFVLSENQVIPTISLNNSQPNTSCNPANSDGEIHIDITPAGTYNFEYYFSNGTQVVDGGSVTGSTTADVTGLINDTYKVVAVSPTPLECPSDTLLVIVGLDLPVVAVAESNNIDNTVCVADGAGGNPDANGQVTLTPSTTNPAVEPTGGYNFALETSGGTAINNAGGTAG